MPSLLVDIGMSIARLEANVVSAQKTLTGFAKNAERAFTGLSSIVGSMGLAMGAREAITAFMDAEKASMRLALALKNQGEYSQATMKNLSDYADQVQEVTGQDNDLVISLMATMKTYGLQNEELKRATMAVMDYSAQMGVSHEQAAAVVGKAALGITTGLKRVGIAIDENTPKAEVLNKVLEQLENRFGGAAAAHLETYAGQWTKIKTEFGNVAEEVGHVLLKALEGAAFMANMVAVGFYTIIEAAQSTIFALDKLIKNPTTKGEIAIVSWIDKQLEKIGALDLVNKIRKASDTGDYSAKHWAKTHEIAKDTVNVYTDLKNEALKNADATDKMLTSWDKIDMAMSKTKSGKGWNPLGSDDEAAKKTLAALDKAKEKIADLNIELLGFTDPYAAEIGKITDEAGKMRAEAQKLTGELKTQYLLTIDKWEAGKKQFKLEQDIGEQVEEATKEIELQWEYIQKRRQEEAALAAEGQKRRREEAALAAERIREMIDFGQQSNSVFDGMNAAILEMQQNLMTWGKVGYEVMMGFAQASKYALSDVFFDAMKGEMKSFSDYWETFTDILYRSFAEALAQMATEWVMTKIFMQSVMGGSMGGYGVPGMGGSMGGFGMESSAIGGALVGAALGGPAGAAIGAVFGSSMEKGAKSLVRGAKRFIKSISPFHEGGIVGSHSMPRAHDGLALDEVPIIAQTGERVLSRKERAAYEAGATSITINANVITTDDVDSWLSGRLRKLQDFNIGDSYQSVSVASRGII